MKESLLLFEELVNCSVFHDKPVMLFLNKVDIFNDLIQKVDISEECFKDYHGPKNSAKDAIDYISGQFKALRENKDADVFVEVTCAVDKYFFPSSDSLYHQKFHQTFERKPPLKKW